MPKLELYESVRPTLYSGDIIIWQSETLIGGVIQWWSNSSYNHVSMVIRFTEFDVDRVYIIEELGHGAVLMPLSKRLEKHKGHAWVLPLESKLNPIRKSMSAWMMMNLGTGYDYRGLFSNILGRISEDEKRMICSEYCWLAFEYGAGIERDEKFISQYFDCASSVQVFAQDIHRKFENKFGKDKVPRPSDWSFLQELGMYKDRVQIL